MRSKGNNNKLTQIARAPIKVLCKARDLYVRRMLDFVSNGKVGYGSFGGGTPSLPKSFSVNSSKQMNEEEIKQIGQLFSSKKDEICGVKRSYSVGVGKIGKIDEDRPCSFRENANDGVTNLYPRSRSHAVRRKF